MKVYDFSYGWRSNTPICEIKKSVVTSALFTLGKRLHHPMVYLPQMESSPVHLRVLSDLCGKGDRGKADVVRYVFNVKEKYTMFLGEILPHSPPVSPDAICFCFPPSYSIGKGPNVWPWKIVTYKEWSERANSALIFTFSLKEK